MHLVWSLCVVCLKSTPRKHTIRLRWSNEGMSRKSPNLILGPFWLNLKGQKRSHVPLPCSYKFLHGWNFAKPHRYAKMHTILDIDLFSNIEAISNFNPPPPPPQIQTSSPTTSIPAPPIDWVNKLDEVYPVKKRICLLQPWIKVKCRSQRRGILNQYLKCKIHFSHYFGIARTPYFHCVQYQVNREPQSQEVFYTYKRPFIRVSDSGFHNSVGGGQGGPHVENRFLKKKKKKEAKIPS